MAADYTDGGWWGKLDQTAAEELADIIASFPPSKIAKYTRMLLSLFACTDESGCISIGRRTLARNACVSDDSAKRFMAKLQDEQIIVPAGKRTNNAGTYTVRQWKWLVREGGANYRPTPGAKTHIKSPHPGAKTHIKSPHIRESDKDSQAGGSAAAAPPLLEEIPPTISGLEMV